MRPVKPKNKLTSRYFIYAILIIVCTIAIGVAIYMQFYRNENLGVIFKLTKEEEIDEYEVMKSKFLDIFTNNVQVVEQYPEEIQKIRENGDIVILADETQEQTDGYKLDIKIPYFNINEDKLKQINKEIKSTFKDKSQSVISAAPTNNMVIYNVKYKAYVNGDILSLIIMSELKEAESSQRTIFKTYNYNLREHKEVTINEIIEKKNININEANKKIKKEIDESQEQNMRLAEAGYNINVRDSSLDLYKIENAEEYFIGENGYLYVIYPYGNTEFTSEMNVVIFN